MSGNEAIWGDYFTSRGIEPVEVDSKQFARWFRSGEFAETAMQESFGDGYGEPYNPTRLAWGVLKDGRGVYCTTGA